MRSFATLAALGLAFLAPDPALAYLGPGAGLSAIGSALAFLGVVALLIAGFVWYPMKRLMRGIRNRRAPTGADDNDGDGPVA